MTQVLWVAALIVSFFAYGENVEQNTQQAPADDSSQVLQHVQDAVNARIAALEKLNAQERIQAGLKLLENLRGANKFSEAGIQKTAEILNRRAQEIASALQLLETVRCGIEITNRRDTTQTQSLELTPQTLIEVGVFQIVMGQEGKYAISSEEVKADKQAINVSIVKQSDNTIWMALRSQSPSEHFQKTGEVVADAMSASIHNMALIGYGPERSYRVTCVNK